MLKSLTKWFIIPVVLLFIGAFLVVTFYFNLDINPNVISVNQKNNSIKNNKGVISGKFTATEDYLGIISIRFDDTHRVKEDAIFRIKRIGAKDWYHQSVISTESYNTIPLYPFGIPIIEKSKGKTFQFEIRKKFKYSNFPKLSLGSQYPLLISRYQYPKDVLFGNKKLFIEFILKKVSYYIIQDMSWKVFMIYSIPFFLYILTIIFWKKLKKLSLIKTLRKKKFIIFPPYFVVLFMGIAFDIFVTSKNSDPRTLWLTVAWIIGAIAYGLGSKYSFGIALIFLTYSPLLFFANMDWVAEKSAMWAYVFMSVGVAQGIVELKAKGSKKMLSFLKRISGPFRILIYLNSLIIEILRKIPEIILFILKRPIKSIFIFVLIGIFTYVGLYTNLRIESYNKRISQYPVLKIIEPTLVYPSSKIILYGDHFGDNSNKMYALKKDGMKIRPDYWDDKKIIFTVPLGWKRGNMRIWIEKPIVTNGKIEIGKTEPVTIKLLLVTGKFTPDDDKYFEEMRSWQKETLEINGYNSNK